jgi:hypothetical protein
MQCQALMAGHGLIELQPVDLAHRDAAGLRQLDDLPQGARPLGARGDGQVLDPAASGP